MRFKIKVSLLTIIVLAAFLTDTAYAKPLTRGEVSKIIREGEYHANGKPVRKAVKKRKHTKKAAGTRGTRLPYAKETPQERDMPFISIPKSRVRKNNKIFVMEDPGVKRDAIAPTLTEPLDTSEPKMEERIPASEPDAESAN